MSFNKIKEYLLSIYNIIMSKYKYVWTVSGIIQAVISIFKFVPRDKDYLFVCHDVHRNSKKNGLYYAPLIDPIIEELTHKGYSCITLASPFSKISGKKCFGEVIIYNYFILSSLFKRLISTGSFSLKNIETDPIIYSYEKVIKKIQPRKIIGIQPSIELCIAAKKLNTSIYDMQHGLISDINYYNINKRKAFNQDGWPNLILCWDQESSDRIKTITRDSVDSLVVGNPAYHSKFGVELIEEPNLEYLGKSKYRMDVLVTLTYQDYYDEINYKKKYQDNCFIEIGITSELANLIKKTSDIFWRIRLHPIQASFKYSKVTNFLENYFKDCNNIDWLSYTNISLGSALTNCSGHITIDSAAALDAAQNSIPSILVGCPGWSDSNKINKYFKEYISSNMMKYIEPNHLDYKALDFFLKDHAESKNNNIEAVKKFKSFIDEINL